jgi:hypothetical protein
MTYCNVTIKANTQSLDTDDMETLICMIGSDNVTITECADYVLPSFVLSKDVDDILQYITNVEEYGNPYEVYCDYHSTIIDSDVYESVYRSSHTNKRSIAEDYLECLELDLPTIISTNLDYDGIVDDLDYLILQGSIELHLFAE